MICSVSNPLIQLARRLTSTKYRNETGLILLEGEKFVAHALQKGWVPVHILVDEAHKDAFLCYDQTRIVEKRLFSSFSSTKTPQGIAAIFPKPVYDLKQCLSAVKQVLFLNCVQDSANVGALIRSADCAGFDLVLLDAQCCDPFSPKAIRSSAASVLDVAVMRTTDAENLLALFLQEGFCLVGTSLQGEENLVFPPAKNVLLLGSEGQGLAVQYQNLCTRLVKLPMRGGAQSLNVAAAGVLLMYRLNHLL